MEKETKGKEQLLLFRKQLYFVCFVLFKWSWNVKLDRLYVII